MVQREDAAGDQAADGRGAAIDKTRLEIERARTEAEISHLRAQENLATSENEKAKLEIEELKTKRSPGGAAPVLKALAVFAGVLAGTLTAWLGIAQLEEGRILKNEDNFQSLVRMLGETTPGLRLGAVAGMQRFTPDDSSAIGILTWVSRKLVGVERPVYRDQVVQLLVSHLGYEPDQAVRFAIGQAIVSVGRSAEKATADVLVARRESIRQELARLVVGKDQDLLRRRRNLQYGAITVALAHAELTKGKPDISCLALSGLELAEADLREVDLSGATMKETDLFGANLEGAKLVSARAVRTQFVGANLSGADFRDAVITGADFRQARHIDVKMFEGANWRDAILDPHVRQALQVEFATRGPRIAGPSRLEKCSVMLKVSP